MILCAMEMLHGWWHGIFFVGCLALTGDAVGVAEAPGEILTPPPPPAPRINSPSVFGVSPGAPFLYLIPATGERPMEFSVDGLPAGLTVNAADGRITGALKTAGEYLVTLRARNALGQAEKKFKIVCGARIALTPPMGWNSWNCWAQAVDQEKVLRSARTLVASGLSQHGWTYINIDDTWQGRRTLPTLALQPNERFPDMKKLCADIHALGLKTGIYSSPWITTFAGFPGGSSDNAEGAWERLSNYEPNKRIGRYSFAQQDATQWAGWGIDYLKYDWAPNDLEHVKEMSLALRATGRDIVFSLSCSTPIELVSEFARWANCWRTTGDIWDTWDLPGPWQNGVSEIGFNQDSWVPYGGPAHWNDPDMLVIGHVGWGPQLHASRLTPAEQYSHLSLWCLLSAPLLIGCDLERLDPFTLNLLTNDEVLALDQDALGRSARRIATSGPIDVFRKELEDGGVAVGFFNRGDTVRTVTAKLDRIGLGGRQHVRDLWRQQDLPEILHELAVAVEPHGVMLYKFRAAR
ncbi:MAG TPA: putative Ig domain-containing protein [Opitutaceae bacterium]|nr:putative Ig domain-containing protein [Opitutaceae bacterium]